MRTDVEIRTEVIEILAELEHEQWSDWVSRVIATEDNISSARLKRWERLSRTIYRNLTEEEKEADRFWARKAYDTIAQSIRILNEGGALTRGEDS
jgi:RNA polymerase-interacting CarD/CdnL/TRCF family regulator